MLEKIREDKKKSIAIGTAIVIITGFGYYMYTKDLTTAQLGQIQIKNAPVQTEMALSSATATKDVATPVKENTVSQPAKKPEVVDVKLNGFMYGYSVKEIRVKKGDTVKIDLTSTDGFHDWVVDEFNAKTERVKTGGTASVTFIADKTGTFEYYCSVGSHRANGMVGKLIVE